ADFTWTFDFGAKRWTNRNPSTSTPTTHFGTACSYDPVTRKVWWVETRYDRSQGLYSYDYDANRWPLHSGAFSPSYQTSTVDTKRGLLVIVGKGEVFVYDLRKGNYAR